jgi:RNase P/RNase MRP subunit p30
VQEYGHGKVLTVCAESIFGIRAPMSVLSLAALWYVLPVVKA